MMRRSGSPCDRRGGAVGPPAVPWEPSQLSGLWLRLRAGDATTGAWVDEVGGRSFTGAGTPTINATDALFGNQPSVSFDGVDDVYTDGGDASDYDFSARTDTGTPWLIAGCLRMSSPTTAAIQRCVSWGNQSTQASFSLYKQGVALGNMNCGALTNGNGNPQVSTFATWGTGVVWFVYGFDPTLTGASVTGVNYRRSLGSYTTKAAYSWTGPYTAACGVAMVIGRSPGGSTQWAPFRLAELFVAKTQLTSGISDSIRTYFNATYGAVL